MIKGLMLTPPAVGRISIGKVVERHGKRLPEKDDEFTLTTQVQTRSGWALHPLDGILRAEQQDRALMASGMEVAGWPRDVASPDAVLPHTATAKPRSRKAEPVPPPEPVSPVPTADAKLRCIPVRLLFNDPRLNLRASYTLFDRATARPLCVGDGQHCKRVTHSGVESLPCPGPDHCAVGIEGGCKLFGRFNVRIDHPENRSDAFSTFVLRTTSVNTLRTLMARMQYLKAVSGGLLAFLPLELRLRGKSTAQSYRAPIYYVDLGLRESLEPATAVLRAREEMQQAQAAGLDLAALETAAREGYAQGLFEETDEDACAVVQEFYPPAQPGAEPEGAGQPKAAGGLASGEPGQRQVPTATLATRLDDRMRRSLRSRPGDSAFSGASHG